MKFLTLFSRKKDVPSKPDASGSVIQFDVRKDSAGNNMVRLADIEQSIGGVRQLTQAGIDEMVARKHDLEFQYALCQRLMADGDILPFPFERAVILLRKAKRFEDEQAICRYVANWCQQAEKNWDGRSAKHWLSPRLRRIVARNHPDH